MRHLLIIVLLLAAAGCARTDGGRPETVALSAERIVVRMNTGTRCLGVLRRETRTATGWAGRLEGCPAGYAYEVTLKKGTTPLRMVLEAVTGALGGEGLLAPRAQVQITGPEGQVWHFRSPPSEEPRAGSANP